MYCLRRHLVLIALAAMLLGRTYAEDSTPITDLPKVTRVRVQDSVEDWQGQGLLIRTLAGDSIHLSPSTEFMAVGRLGWSEEGLLLHVEVTDPTPFEPVDLNHLLDGDSVELLLMTGDNDKAGMIQLVASPGLTSNSSAARYKIFDYRDKEFKKDLADFTPRVTAKRSDRGYLMDLLLPWSSMGITPSLGTIIKVGFAINHSVSQGDKNHQRAIWINHLPKSEWMKLSPVRLADKPSNPDPIAVWAGFDQFKTGYANVVADPELAGQKIAVLEKEQILAQGILSLDGDRAVGTLLFPLPPIGQKYDSLDITLDGKVVRTLTLPDINGHRRDLFSTGGGAPSYDEHPPVWTSVVCKSEVFNDEKFPVCDFLEPDKMRELVGPYTVKTDYYDVEFKPVDKAVKPGRYGAVATFTSAAGDSFVAYRTLYRVPLNEVVKPDVSVYFLAATSTETSAVDKFLAKKADRDWWHALRKKLGSEVKYEYYVRLPKGYNEDPGKRWPVIFYLHGVGGGKTMEGVQNNGIQIPAREWPVFPFIAVSLRSEQGWKQGWNWFQPAVKDVVDEVATKYRTDPTRYYLTGFSMGGWGTWDVALDQPDRFAAIAAIGRLGGDPAHAARVKDVPAWIINGTEDHSASSSDAINMVRALKDVGGEIKWTEIPGADHVQSHVIAYQWPELYAWFLIHHR